MPAFIKTKKDEKMWDEAKKAADKSGKKAKDYWALVNHIYQNMKKSHSAADELEALANALQD